MNERPDLQTLSSGFYVESRHSEVVVFEGWSFVEGDEYPERVAVFRFRDKPEELLIATRITYDAGERFASLDLDVPWAPD